MTAADRPSRLPLCADVSRALGEDPIGTAPHWQEVTVLELDVPVWSKVRDVANWTPQHHRLFERLRGKVEASGAGFGLLMSAPATRGQPLRVRHYTLGAGGYGRRDYASDLPQAEWVRGLTDTLLDPQHLSAWEEQAVPLGPDVHVCTHGTVDAACGRYGVPVYHHLAAAGERAWRTGHFGGHRFAATAVELPSGLLWAHLTPDLAVQVARREVPPAEVARHLRGFSGLPPLAQVVDRDLLVRHGWDWLAARRWAEVDGEDVTLQFEWRGECGLVRATVTHDLLSVPGSSHKPEWSDVRQYRLQWTA
ncbi:sucrase ferredoxin [Deinococcus sp. KSM4-11]|uniref:sucrase ferredoxin n=1 Tax=Deinococcus sp. KSM4-11 TaxID=2568654 RepID=UPI0010A3C4D5|nr:sucrase ferredoxin [Deinococcus sp. KSM4-11]THF87953.1 sucrase ferredoxin [Deinococcus sp. KSM4-11]